MSIYISKVKDLLRGLLLSQEISQEISQMFRIPAMEYSMKPWILPYKLIHSLHR